MRLKHRRFAVPVAAAIMVAGLLSGCAGSDSPDGSAALRTLYAESSTDPTSFDPAAARAGDDYVAGSLLYATVLNRDLDGSLIAGLASEWSAESASKYTLTIADGATCADGTPITASVVANSLNYFGEDKAGDHPSAPLAFGVGAPTITSDDASSTVTIETAAPYANLLPGLALPQSGIICPAGLADLDGLKAGTVEAAFSGPYTLGEAKPGVSYAYDLREDYDAWPRYTPALAGSPAPRIVFSAATDAATSANKLISGDLDIGYLSGETLDRFEGDQSFNQLETIYVNVSVIFNERPGRYFAGKADARQAVAQAIDRTAINKLLTNGMSPLFDSIVPSTYECVNTDKSLIEEHDPAAAETLDGASFKILAANSFGDQGKSAEYLREVLTEAGAEVDLVLADNATWATEIQNPAGDWDVTLISDLNASKLIDASLSRVMGQALEEGGRNLGAADNIEGAEALKAAMATSDTTEQCEHYQTAQRTMLERDDVVPLAGLIWVAISPNDVEIQAPGGNLNYTTARIVGH